MDLSQMTATDAMKLYDAMSDQSADLKVLSGAYMMLLMMPHGKLRANIQPLLAMCRDCLAEAMHMDQETVQNAFEHMARAAPPQQ